MIQDRHDGPSGAASAALRAHLDRIVAEGLVPPHPDDPPDQNAVPERDSRERHTVRFRAACLYLDVRGSSDLLTLLGPRPAAQLIRTLILGAAAVTKAHGGHVRGVHGDALLAFFSGGDRALRAIETAVEIDRFTRDALRPRLDAVPQYRAATLSTEPGFEVGYGVDEGPVCALPVDTEGAADRIWAGRCTNTAAKLAKYARGERPVTVTREALASAWPAGDVPSPAHWSEERHVRVAGTWRTVRVGGRVPERPASTRQPGETPTLTGGPR